MTGVQLLLGQLNPWYADLGQSLATGANLVWPVAFVLLGISNIPFGGTSLLIIVGVGLETVKQIDSQLQQRHYEGLLR